MNRIDIKNDSPSSASPRRSLASNSFPLHTLSTMSASRSVNPLSAFPSINSSTFSRVVFSSNFLNRFCNAATRSAITLRCSSVNPSSSSSAIHAGTAAAARASPLAPSIALFAHDASTGAFATAMSFSLIAPPSPRRAAFKFQKRPLPASKECARRRSARVSFDVYRRSSASIRRARSSRARADVARSRVARRCAAIGRRGGCPDVPRGARARACAQTVGGHH